MAADDLVVGGMAPPTIDDPGRLAAVVVSGGEPLLQAAVVDAVAGIKAMGFSVALHTGGSHPARLRHLLPHLDWEGFDAKTAFDAYAGITGIAGNGEKASRSALPRTPGRGSPSVGPDPYPLPSLAWILAQVSRRATVRLNTGLPGAESRSKQK